MPNSRTAEIVVPERVRFTVQAPDDRWELIEGNAALEFTLGVAWIPELVQSLHGIPQGSGDYSIGPATSPHRLWFWWQPAI